MLFKLAWRNIWRNKRRSLITIASIFVAVFLAVFMRSMQLGMYSSMIDNVVGAYTGYVQIHKKGYWEEQKVDNSLQAKPKLLQTITSTKGVKNIIPRLQIFTLASNGELAQGVMVNGVIQDKENLLIDWGTRLNSGQLLSGKDDELVIAKGIAKIFEVELGDTMVFIGQGYHGTNAAGKYVISGIVNLKNPKLNNISVFLNLKTAQNYIGAHNLLTHLIVDKKDIIDEEVLSSNLKSKLGKNYEIMTWREMIPELEQTIQADSVAGLIMIFILYMIITFGIFGTVLMMTQERTYEFGVLVAIGMKKTKLALTMILETIMLTLIGIFSGAVSVMPFAYYFHKNPIVLSGDYADTMENFGFDPVIPLSIDLSIPLTHGFIIFLISLIIALYPSWYIFKMDPVKSMKR
ncbi:FtsX-like permease family protein [Aureispira]|nr:FtsX-like permease family protein [Aureispira sp.]